MPVALAPKPLRKDAARNRELLLTAAEEVFSEQGLDACVDDVARRAGVGTGTLYRRFPTKDALVNELAHHLLARVVEAASSAASRRDGSATSSFLTGVGEQFAKHGGLLSRLWIAPNPPEEITALRVLMADIVAQDQAAGAIRSGITAADLSLVLWGLQGVVEIGATAAPEAWRRHIDLMLAGMSAGNHPLTTAPVTRDQLDAVSRLRAQRG